MIAFPIRLVSRGSVLAMMIALAACAHAPHGVSPQAAPAPVLDHQGKIDQIVALLDQGQKDAAAKKIAAMLKHDPADPQARVLQDSIDKDPVELLGPKSFAYTVKPGETMLGLSERFLGNTLKSYELARYNGITVPSALAAGQTLKIPGEAPRPDTPPRSEPAVGHRSEPTAPHPKPVAAPASAAPVANPALAARMRGVGLAALNQGNVDRALGLLRRAASLDPANKLIARDLQRAERISQTVKAKH